MMKKLLLLFTVFLLGTFPLFSQLKPYKNFEVAVYSRSYEVEKMGDLKWLENIWEEITHQVHVDKIYLETHRDLVIVQEDTLEMVKKFFEKRGIKTAGGITLTIDESNRFQTFCYSKDWDRNKVKEIVEYTAKHFDELILDDFFFTSCKCETCIEKKGDQSWTDYRLNLMDEAARNIIIGPAKEVNPDIKVVIKYPNWYEHFQGLGFNLETQPGLFDGIYTGTETRDAVRSNQHLQPYHGYQIFRYFENLKPGGNGGGWVDTGGLTDLDRYAEQLWLTLFAKAPEITLFDFRQLQRTLDQFERAEWQGQNTSFDLDEMMKPYKGGKKTDVQPTTVARAAGYSFEKIDGILGELGKPIGVASYRPFHSTGEDFLHNYLGMIGIPINLNPTFPEDASVVLLTESAKFDENIVPKIKQHLLKGKKVVITSGLLKALEDRGIQDIAELRYSDRKASVHKFKAGWGEIVESEKTMIIPEILYLTNDSWENVSAIDGPNGWPILHEASYAESSLFVLVIPENFADLYQIPAPALNRIRADITNSMPVQLEGPGSISLMIYDNNTIVVESFRDEETEISITSFMNVVKLIDIQTEETIGGTIRKAPVRFNRPIGKDKVAFDFRIKPHSFRVFRIE